MWVSRFLIGWLVLASMPVVRADPAAVISKVVDRDEMCGSVHVRTRGREACSEESWRVLCEELDDALDDPPLRRVEDQTVRFVGKLARDLLCRPAEPPDGTLAAGPVSKWDDLDSIHRHRAALTRAAELFAAELSSATAVTARGLADLGDGAAFFRVARERGVGQPGTTDKLRDRFRFIDDDGEDLTEYVYRELIERAESSIDEVWAVERVFEGRPLATLELAQNRVRLLNALRLLDWGLATFETDQVIRIPAWLVADEPSAAETEIAVPHAPDVFRVGTGLSPLSRPSALPEVERRVASFFKAVAASPEEKPPEATCLALATGVSELESEVYGELERLLFVENPDGYRSVRPELFAFELLGVISRGNRGLVDYCGQDRNDVRWHRRFMQQTVDLTRALDSGAGRLLKGLLRNSFSERIE